MIPKINIPQKRLNIYEFDYHSISLEPLGIGFVFNQMAPNLKAKTYFHYHWREEHVTEHPPKNNQIHLHFHRTVSQGYRVWHAGPFASCCLVCMCVFG